VPNGRSVACNFAKSSYGDFLLKQVCNPDELTFRSRQAIVHPKSRGASERISTGVTVVDACDDTKPFLLLQDSDGRTRILFRVAEDSLALPPSASNQM
jgi:hypothetical protein